MQSLAIDMATVLSLFDYTGNWPRPYAEQGHNVICLDLKHGHDLTEMDCAFLNEHVLDDYGQVDAILAAPPCTDFAVSGAQYWKQKDADGRTEQSIHLVRQVLRAVEYLKPQWWALENPVGRLNQCVPELEKYGPWYFDPCDFGDPYTKRTGLWGTFTPPLPLFIGADMRVEPVRVCSQGSWLMRLGGKSERTKELRSETPMGFAYAFAQANPLSC
jgi:hypothetical protein